MNPVSSVSSFSFTVGGLLRVVVGGEVGEGDEVELLVPLFPGGTPGFPSSCSSGPRAARSDTFHSLENPPEHSRAARGR